MKKCPLVAFNGCFLSDEALKICLQMKYGKKRFFVIFLEKNKLLYKVKKCEMHLLALRLKYT